jgi:hypothetical protein
MHMRQRLQAISGLHDILAKEVKDKTILEPVV